MNPAQELPTPYDIISIPYFAYSPTWQDWMLLALLLIFIFACSKIRLVYAHIHKFKKSKIFDYAVQQINNLLSSPEKISNSELNQVCIMLKRLLEVYFNQTISTLSIAELENLSEKNSLTIREKSILLKIVNLEQNRFQKDKTISREFIAANIDKLPEDLQQLKKQFLARRK